VPFRATVSESADQGDFLFFPWLPARSRRPKLHLTQWSFLNA